MENSLPIQQQSKTGVLFLDLALASNQTSNGNSISYPTAMSDQGLVGGTMSYFTSNVARAESEVLVKQVVVPKDKRRIPSSREFGIQYSKVMVALNMYSRQPGNFLPTSWEGETDQPDHNIQ